MALSRIVAWIETRSRTSVVQPPLHYARTDDGYVVYSIGSDGKDDGGRPVPRDEAEVFNRSSDGDLRIDVLLAPVEVEAGTSPIDRDQR